MRLIVLITGLAIACGAAVSAATLNVVQSAFGAVSMPAEDYRGDTVVKSQPPSVIVVAKMKGGNNIGGGSNGGLVKKGGGSSWGGSRPYDPAVPWMSPPDQEDWSDFDAEMEKIKKMKVQ